MKHTFILLIFSTLFYSCGSDYEQPNGFYGDMGIPEYEGKRLPELSNYPKELDTSIHDFLDDHYSDNYQVNNQRVKYSLVSDFENWYIDSNEYDVLLTVTSKGKKDKWLMQVQKINWLVVFREKNGKQP